MKRWIISTKGESFMNRWIMHEKVNHTWKGESYIRSESYMKGWIVLQKVNYSGICERDIKRWKMHEKVNHTWKVNHQQKVNDSWHQKVKWKGESYMKTWIIQQKVNHTKVKSMKIIQMKRWIHTWKGESYMKRWIIYEVGERMKRWIMHEKVNHTVKRWILQQKVNHSGICESHIKRWNVAW